ncbi:hypothetical protein HYALB_00004393 [Hymenoscyphus albidus]|uniref:Uncharacterized protein n=1 Tax=Hymenoscyphus albidus TaxID=595503 RepID=A0A9N9Q5N3_9HELO|nr:hypothetical protein HYALB_00004393 [Hymenoscyphus albidus]
MNPGGRPSQLQLSWSGASDGLLTEERPDEHWWEAHPSTKPQTRQSLALGQLILTSLMTRTMSILNSCSSTVVLSKHSKSPLPLPPSAERGGHHSAPDDCPFLTSMQMQWVPT